MNAADLERRLILLLNLALATGFLALAGWGTAYSVKAIGSRPLREEVTRLKADQQQLQGERDYAKAQLAAAQQEVAALTKRVEDMQVAAVTPVPSSAPSVKPEAAKSKRR